MLLSRESQPEPTTPGPAGRRTLVSDEELMRRIQSGDTRAFEDLYDRHSARAFGLALFICRDHQRAEDAVQDGFLAIWRRRATYNPARGGARPWLLTVLRHCSIDVLRRAGTHDRLRASDIELEFLAAPGCVVDGAAMKDDAERVRASLRALPALQRQAIALAYFGGLTHTEIAARLQLPAGTVKGRIRLGMDKVRAHIDTTELRQNQPPEHRA